MAALLARHSSEAILHRPRRPRESSQPITPCIIEGGYPAIRKLDEAFNFLTAEELRQIRAMAEHGDKAQALDVAIAALHRRFDGLREQAMGPAEQGLHRLSAAWNDLIESVAVSEPVMKAVANLAGNMEALSKWVAGPTDADKGFELSHQIVSENKRLLELQHQRTRLPATRETARAMIAACREPAPRSESPGQEKTAGVRRLSG
jgi:phage-related minor tail protein